MKLVPLPDLLQEITPLNMTELKECVLFKNHVWLCYSHNVQLAQGEIDLQFSSF